MIHIRAQAADLNDQPVLHISLVGITSLEQFENILARALNCADPQKYAEWVAVSDKLQEFLRAADITRL